ncbi:MAG: C-terminal binding protein [candidate division Zixibacteria bacterium]|nr:C-terminal binding protein [candidate division Zixibacteria bacterium]
MPRFTILTPGNPDDIGPLKMIADALSTVDAVLKVASYHTEAELLEAAKGVDGLMEGWVRMPREVVERLPDQIRVIGSGGIGVDFVDVDAATERGIIVYNLPGVFEREVAHHAMAFLLALARRTVSSSNAMKARQSVHLGPVQHLYGQTLGLVSFGNIGRAMSKLAAAFEFRILAYDPFVSQEAADRYGVTMVDKATLFSESDFVSCHAPLMKGTYRMIREEDFRRMKPSAYFINTGRGKVVDEAAMIRALREGWFAGAGLDVLEQEPPSPDNPLLDMENVLLTHHYASTSIQGGIARREKAARQLVTILSGRWPKDGLVNPAVKPLAARKWGMPAE